MHDLHLRFNPHGTNLTWHPSGISFVDQQIFCRNNSTVLLILPTRHQIFDTISWPSSLLTDESCFVLAFIKDQEASDEKEEEFFVDCDDNKNMVSSPPSSPSPDADCISNASSESEAQTENIQDCNDTSSAVNSQATDDNIQDEDDNLSNVDSLLDDIICIDDVDSECSYDVERVDAHVAQTRSMAKRKQEGIDAAARDKKESEKRLNALNVQHGFYPIPFGERCVHLQRALREQAECRCACKCRCVGKCICADGCICVEEKSPIFKICSNIARRFDRIAPSVTCTCTVRNACHSTGHVNNKCEVCNVQIKGAKYHHARAKFTVKDRDNREGQASIDLLCRGHKDLMLVMVTEVAGANVVLALPVKSKQTKALIPVLWQLFNLAAYFYDVAVSRVHCDRESGVFHARTSILPVHTTFTISGDHSANPMAENFNRSLTRGASKAVAHLTSAATRRNLWSYAVSHTAYVISQRNLGSKDCQLKGCRLSGQTMVPFLALGFAKPHLGDKLPRVDQDNSYAVYLGPCSLTPLASLVLIIKHDPHDTKSNFCVGDKVISVRGFSPCDDEEKHAVFPNVHWPGKEQEELTAVCRTCSLTRYMEKDQFDKLVNPGGEFTCEPTNATCGEPMIGLCRARKGAKKGAQHRKGKLKSKLDKVTAAVADVITESFTECDSCPLEYVDVLNADVREDVATELNNDIEFEDFLNGSENHLNFVSGVSADIEHMIESTSGSVRNMASFKADALATMDELNNESKSAFLTKLLTKKEELEAKDSVEAISVEAHQLFEVDKVVDVPMNQDDAVKQFPNATASPAMLIVSIKNYEFHLNSKRQVEAACVAVADARRKVDEARAFIAGQINDIMKDHRADSESCKSASGLAQDSIYKRIERVIAMEARTDEFAEILDMISMEDKCQDGNELVPKEFQEKGGASELKGASSDAPKHKCRVVVRGDIVQLLRDFIERPTHKPVGNSADTPSVWSATVSLTGFRSVVLHSVLHRFELRSIDLPSAFVQVPWPEELPPHFLKFPKNIQDVMSEKYRGSHLSSPVWRMVKMIYGHRLSGWQFCRKLHAILVENDFVPTEWCNAILVHKTRNIVVCTYVDDLAFSGSKADEDFLMQCVDKGGLKIGEQAESCRKYLGTKVTTCHGDDVSIVRFSQAEYAHAICTMYADLYGKTPALRRFPGAWNASASCEVQRDVHQALPPSEKPSKVTPAADLHRRQVIVGMLLWHSRSVRADISGYVNHLATRLHVWNDHDDVLMSQLIGFLRFSAEKSLVWRIPHDVALSVHSSYDANLHVPRSHCSYVVSIGNRDNQCYAMVDWANKRASLSCTASAASELCAAYYTASNVTGLCGFLASSIDTNAFERENDGVDFRLLGDNLSALLVLQKGYSPMANAWSAPRAFGLRLSVLHQMHAHRIFDCTHVKSKWNMSDLASKVSHPRETFLVMSEMCGISFGVPKFVIPVDLSSDPNMRLSKSLT